MRHLLALTALLPALALGSDLVGPETCKACHPAAWAAWREGPHARALESLPASRRADRRCLTCHAPSTDLVGAGVTCEACHGPGRLYAAPYVMRDPVLARAVGLVDPGERTCLACHTESTPSLGRFDYARKRLLIAHPDRPPAATPPAGRAPPAPAGK